MLVENRCCFIRASNSRKRTKPYLAFNKGSSMTKQALASGAVHELPGHAHLRYETAGTAEKK